MKYINTDGLTQIGFGSFFVVFRLTRRRVLKMPRLDYCVAPTPAFERVLKRARITVGGWLVLDAVQGARQHGALPVSEIVYIYDAGELCLGIVAPYARPLKISDVGLNGFIARYPHWKWDHELHNYGMYKGAVVRIDTQTDTLKNNFTWSG